MLILGISLPLGARAETVSRAAEPATSQATADDEGSSCMAPVAPAPTAMKAYIDPTTGQLAPSPADAQDAALPMPLNRHPHTPGERLVEQPVASGGASIDLGNRFLSFSTATKSQDGKLSISHNSFPASK
jgi:hypothetical protein